MIKINDDLHTGQIGMSDWQMYLSVVLNMPNIRPSKGHMPMQIENYRFYVKSIVLLVRQYPSTDKVWHCQIYS